MAILAHGSDLNLAPTAAPVVRSPGDSGGTLRGALECLKQAGFRAVQLDAALPGIRPRDLGPRTRQDLLALLGRCGFSLGGLDLFIPRRHYTEPQHIDRAVAATLAAIELAADLGRVPLSVALPVRDLSEETRSAMVAAADGHGVRLAVHAEDQWEHLRAWVEAVDLPALSVALDPAAVLGMGRSPSKLVHAAAKRLGVARLSDVIGSSATPDPGDTLQTPEEKAAPPPEGLALPGAGVHAPGVRCDIGQGDLDLTTYRIAVDLATSRSGPVVLDLRGLPGPVAAATTARHAWDNAGLRL